MHADNIGSSIASDTREAILDAADCLLGRFGYSKMTMDDLAREAGIGRRTIYLYFQSKEQIALSSIDRVVSRLLDRLREIAAKTDSADERLRRMLVERVLFRVDSVKDYYRSFDDLFAEIRPAYMERRKRYFEAEAKVFAKTIEEGVRAESLDAQEPASAAQTLIVATNSLLPYSLSSQELDARDEIARKAGAIADMLLCGLKSRTRG